MRRRSFLLGVAGTGACVAIGRTAETLPLIPFSTTYIYYDHGWIQWTPSHPEFESIEAQVIEARPNAPAFIRVFFSRRAGDKSQVFYFTDEAVARNWATGTAHVADIRYEVTGAPGGPRGLDVRFTDASGAQVVWTMRMAPDARLYAEGAGLRASVGHSRKLIFSLPLRGPSAIARESRLTIGGADHSMPPQTRPEFRYGVGGGYSQSEATSLLRLTPHAVRPVANGLAVNERNFTTVPASGITRYRSESGVGQRPGAIEIDTRGGALVAYRHFSGDHEWRFDFPESLPPLSAIREGARLPMTMSWDGAILVRAAVTVERATQNGTRLRWHADEPAWLSERQIVIDIAPAAEGYTARPTWT